MWETPIFLHIWHMSCMRLQSSERFLSVLPPIHCHQSYTVVVPVLWNCTGGVWLLSPGMLEDVVASPVLVL